MVCAKKKRATNFVCTSHESLETILATYPTAPAVLSELQELGAHVLHDVDATCLHIKGATSLPIDAYDIVLWNFPCVRAVGGKDGQVQELEDNKDLVRRFFTNVQGVLTSNGEVHVTHKTLEPFCWWKIVDIAEAVGLRYEGSVIFDRYLYPGYINRKALDKKSFPLNDAQTYIFRAAPANAEEIIIPCASLSSAKLQPLNDPTVMASIIRVVKSIGQEFQTDNTDHDPKDGKSKKKHQPASTIDTSNKRQKYSADR